MAENRSSWCGTDSWRASLSAPRSDALLLRAQVFRQAAAGRGAARWERTLRPRASAPAGQRPCGPGKPGQPRVPGLPPPRSATAAGAPLPPPSTLPAPAREPRRRVCGQTLRAAHRARESWWNGDGKLLFQCASRRAFQHRFGDPPHGFQPQKPRLIQLSHRFLSPFARPRRQFFPASGAPARPGFWRGGQRLPPHRSRGRRHRRWRGQNPHRRPPAVRSARCRRNGSPSHSLRASSLLRPFVPAGTPHRRQIPFKSVNNQLSGHGFQPPVICLFSVSPWRRVRRPFPSGRPAWICPSPRASRSCGQSLRLACGAPCGQRRNQAFRSVADEILPACLAQRLRHQLSPGGIEILQQRTLHGLLMVRARHENGLQRVGIEDRCRTCRWKWCPAWDKNPAPVPGAGARASGTAPVPRRLSACCRGAMT